MTTLTLSVEQARETLWDDSDEYEVVQDEDHGSGRWSSHHYVVICKRGAKDTGPYYGASYSQGLTENQDERPWDYEDEVTFDQVIPQPKTVIEFVPIAKVTQLEVPKAPAPQ